MTNNEINSKTSVFITSNLITKAYYKSKRTKQWKGTPIKP
jgi:hypothetical protein